MLTKTIFSLPTEDNNKNPKWVVHVRFKLEFQRVFSSSCKYTFFIDVSSCLFVLVQFHQSVILWVVSVSLVPLYCQHLLQSRQRSESKQKPTSWPQTSQGGRKQEAFWSRLRLIMEGNSCWMADGRRKLRRRDIPLFNFSSQFYGCMCLLSGDDAVDWNDCRPSQISIYLCGWSIQLHQQPEINNVEACI